LFFFGKFLSFAFFTITTRVTERFSAFTIASVGRAAVEEPNGVSDIFLFIN